MYHGEPMAVVDARDAPEEEEEGSWELIGKVFRSPPVMVMALVYFLLKPARYAILFWGPVIASERLTSNSFALAATLPAAFEGAGLLAPIAIGFVSDKLFQARRFPACVLSLVLLSAVLLLFGPLTSSGSSWGMLLAFFLIGLFLYGPDSMVSATAAIDFGTKKGAGSAAGFINGFGSFGQILGVALPGYLMVWFPGRRYHRHALLRVLCRRSRRRPAASAALEPGARYGKSVVGTSGPRSLNGRFCPGPHTQRPKFRLRALTLAQRPKV